jgi:hypothetical protein
VIQCIGHRWPYLMRHPSPKSFNDSQQIILFELPYHRQEERKKRGGVGRPTPIIYPI